MPVNYLKELNQSISCQLFRMEGLNLLEEILEERSYFCKLDFKDAHFCVAFNTNS